MSVHNDVGEVVHNVWTETWNTIATPGEDGNGNKDRSSKWLDTLARHFEQRYQHERHRALWSGSDKHQEDMPNP